MAILVNTAALTMVEPDAAPKAADDMTVAMASPPRNPPSQTYAVRNRSVVIAATVAKDPIRMNRGITAKANELVVPKGIAASCAKAASGPTVR